MVLGKYGSRESIQRYQNFLSRLDGQSELVVRPGQWPTIEELSAAYLTFAEGFYRREIAPGQFHVSSEYAGMVHALGALNSFADMNVSAFGPKSLVSIRLQLAKGPLVRSTINHVLSRLKKFFRWACENELAPPDLYHKLVCVRGLVRGQDGCREAEPVTPAPQAALNALLPYLSPMVGVMAQTQYYCGMRPGEVCIMRAPDIDMSGDVWIYRPARHKSQWRGLSQVKAIPPRAQKLLLPYLLNAPYLFCPGRKREHYVAGSYRRAFGYGFAKARKQGVELERFSPNQLRHSILTHVSQELGHEAAQLWAWHEAANTTSIYVEKQEAELKNVARQLEARWAASA